MEIVKYVIAYKFLLGELPRYIVQSINIDENLDADFMHRLCESLVKDEKWQTQGTLANLILLGLLLTIRSFLIFVLHVTQTLI